MALSSLRCSKVVTLDFCVNSILGSCAFFGVVPKENRHGHLPICAFTIASEVQWSSFKSVWSFWIFAVSWIVKSVAIDTLAGGFYWVLDLSSIFDLFSSYFLLYYTIWICSVMSVWHFIFGWSSVFHIVVIPSCKFPFWKKKKKHIKDCGIR